MKSFGKRLVPWVLAAFILGLGVSAREAAAAQAAAPAKDTAPEAANALEPADILARARPAVGVILAQDAKGETLTQGSAIIATTYGLVVTNWHVVGGASSAAVKQESGAFYPVEGVVAWNAEQDFAILQIAGKGLPTIPLGDSDKVRQGDRVLVLGSPQGLENTASEGIVSAVRELPNGQKLLQTTAAISEGSSGGPILDMQGQVVGIASFMLREGQSLNFAIPINEVKPKVKAGKVTPLVEARLPSATGNAEALYLEGVRALPQDVSAPDAPQKFEAALALFRRAIELHQDYPGAHVLAGYCLSKLGRGQEAVEACKQAIRIKPDYAEAYVGLGIAYCALARWQEAVEACKRAIRLKPDLASAHYNLAAAYASLGRDEEAVEESKQAIRIKPDYAEAHFKLGAGYGKLGRWQEAVEAFKEGVRIKPDYHNGQYLLGVAYGNLGRWQEAADARKEAIRIKPDDAEAHSSLGWAYVKLHRWQEAVTAYKDAIRIRPDHAAAHCGLGQAYGILGRYQEAVEAFREAIRIKPDYANAHYYLGFAYLRLGERGSALDEYKILKDLDDDMAADLFKLIYP